MEFLIHYIIAFFLITGISGRCSDQTQGQLYENATAGTVVARIKCDSTDTVTIEDTSKYDLEDQGSGYWVAKLKHADLDVDTGSSMIFIHFRYTETPDYENTLSVNRFVADVNDVTPQLKNQPYITSIPENAPINSSVNITISYEDPDTGQGGNVTLTFQNDNNCDSFKLEGKRLILMKSLDFETTTFYQCTITAEDGGGLKSSASVYITVSDVQDKPPTFVGIPYNWIVSEDNATNSVVGTISAVDGDRGTPNQVNYTIVSTDCPELFQLEKTIGKLKLNDKPDRDSGIVMNNNGVCNLEVMAQEIYSEVSIATEKVVIKVEDINDNAPTFNQGSYTANIRENMPEQSPINFENPGGMIVQDKDQDDNSRFNLSLVSKYADYFEIDPSSVFSKAQVFIRVKNSTVLDFEKLHDITFVVKAEEYATPDKKSSTTTITLVIEDVNDNSPVFSSPYAFSVYENSANGSFVASITANDIDSGIYGNVTYSLSDSTFQIDSESGNLTVKGGLDREKKAIYFLSVKAIDGGNRQTLQSYTITILDENDNQPVFQRKDYEAYLEENSMPSRLIEISATDADDGENSELTYDIENSSPPDLYRNFTINNSSGVLALHGYLDYEALPGYALGTITLNITATDNGAPSQRSHTSVVIHLTDKNEHAPIFNTAQYSVTIKENVSSNEFVIRVSANDSDGNAPNNAISYLLSEGGGGKFKINGKTGDILVSDSLDRETTSSYTLNVTASDRGTPVLSSSAIVTVTIGDVNDANPIFERVEITKDFKENTTNVVDGLKATDRDINSVLRYSIYWNETSGIDSSQNSANLISLQSLLDVNSSSGEILFKRTLDREEFRQLEVVILAQDENAETAEQTATGTMTINVVDIDDNLPQFNANEYTATIDESAQSETPITFVNPKTLSASDKDQGNNAVFVLEVSNPSFQAEPSRVASLASVIIKVKNTSAIDYEIHGSQIQIQVTAKQLTTNKTLPIARILLNIVNVNEDTPTFTNDSYSAEIPEDATTNTFITSIQVNDKDAGKFGQVNLSLSGESDEFAVFNNGSIFYTGNNIDRERKELYYLTIEAVDGGGRRGTVPLEIRITDQNDCPPQFERRDYSATLKENSRQFERDISVKAIDQDKPGTNNSKVEYSIFNSPFSNHFEIDSDNGTISIKKPVDFEEIFSANGAVNLTIIASDKGVPVKKNSASVLISVEDENEYSPAFNLSSYKVTIAENAQRGLHVINVEASDKDGSSPNKDVFYLIESGGSDKFSINSTSGEIKLAGKLDRELESAYTLMIAGVDRGTPANTGTTEVVVRLEDVNDEAPRFYPVSDRVAVNETTQSGIIYYVKANDSDSNSKLHYSFLWNSCEAYNEKQEPVNSTYLQNLLALNHSNGAIRISLSSGLDREIVQQISLTVQVNDTMSEGSQQIAKGKLVIDVLDVNDNAPKFNANLTANLTENMPVGIPLVFSTELVVQDLDKDKNAEFELTLTENGDIFEVVPELARSSATVLIKIKNNTKLDYERYKNFTVKVVAKETSTVEKYSSTATIMVMLKDSNDNDPQFDNKSYVGNIREDAKRGQPVLVVNAIDEDSGSYGNITYVLQGGEGRFDISPDGEVTLDREGLDRETKDVYYLTIVAIDENGSGRRQTAPLEIKITDANDNIPIFKRDSYNAILYEGNSTFEREVIVQADDQDEEQTVNSNITYHIKNTSHNINNVYSNFTLNSITGEFKPNGPINYELLDNSTKGKIKIGVVAKDEGNPQHTSNITYIEINVIDLNDNTPQFEKSLYKGSIPENSTEGQFVNIVKASDDDGSSPNNVVFYLIQTGGNDNFRIDSKTGNVTVGPGAHLDKETEPSFNLTVLAVDRGTEPEPKSSSVIVTIDLTDTNDESPKFTQDSVVKEVLENCTVEETFFQLSATDEDTNSLLRYQILWNISKAYDEKEKAVAIETIKPWFRINSTNGIIVVNSTLDRETAERLIIKVFTEDENNEVPNTSQTATGTLTIILKDVNDESPEVTEGSHIMLNVSESTPVSTELTTLSATDKDKRQTVAFSLGNTSYFDITTNGKISLKRALDREIQDEHEFQVIATDDGIPPKSSLVSVVVNVEDYNDNAPEFNLTQTTFQVPENATNTTLVATIHTFDEDIGPNANITYTLEGSSPFRIISGSGEIYVNEHLDRETKTSYSLTVVAKDNPITDSEKRNKATTVILIDVTDINDNDPVFSDNNYTVKIPETLEIGKEIRDVYPNVIKITDLDSGENSKITCRLDNETYFNITNTAGEVQLRVNKSLRGKVGIYPLTVTATDHGEEPRQSSVSLIIEILDENINSPVFTQPIVIRSIPECIGTNTLVYQFQAIDDDKWKDTNGKVRYKFDNRTGIQDFQYLSLDPDSGNLTLSRKIDYEKVHELKIWVIAYDMGLPPKETKTEMITIKLKDSNDNPPIFNSTKEERTFRVEENKSGIPLGIISAFDPDENSTVVYSIEDSTYMDSFKIESNSGKMEIIRSLDREEVEQLTLKVIAEDPTAIGCKSNSTYNASHTEVHIIIEDVNDNPPRFTEDEVSTGFRSTAGYRTTILDLKPFVSDDDSPLNSIHRYHVMGSMSVNTNTDVPGNPIALSENGTIITNYTFTTNTVGRVTFNVVATDAGGNDTVNVVVYIIGDENVLKMTLLRTPDNVRELQGELMKVLTNFTSIKFVVNGISSHMDEDGKVVDYKTDLFVHGVDKDGKILKASSLQSVIDKSEELQKKISKFLITETDSVVKVKLTDDSETRTKYIFIAVIVCLVVILILTVFVLLNNISRFKRKLKASKINTKTKEKDPNDNNISAILHQTNYRTENPVFEKDIELKQEFDNMSIQSDELDENAVYASFKKVDMFEEEMTIDLYDENDGERSPVAAALFLEEALRRHASDKKERFYNNNLHHETCLDDLESTEI